MMTMIPTTDGNGGATAGVGVQVETGRKAPLNIENTEVVAEMVTKRSVLHSSLVLVSSSVYLRRI